MADEIVSLGERLKHRREELGISQAQAARELDVARTAYRLWEMEAAKPAPDRWRLISRWLGISVATMLLAEELIDDKEARHAELVATRLAEHGASWDGAGAMQQGGFFLQERSLIDRGTAGGILTESESADLTQMFERVEAVTRSRTQPGWREAELRKVLPSDASSAAAARAAMLGTAAGIPTERLLEAELLTSELVANSVQHGHADPHGDIGLHIVLRRSVLRVEVADHGHPSPRLRPQDPPDGWVLVLISEMASRWGSGRQNGANVSWFELDLPHGDGTGDVG